MSSVPRLANSARRMSSLRSWSARIWSVVRDDEDASGFISRRPPIGTAPPSGVGAIRPGPRKARDAAAPLPHSRLRAPVSRPNRHQSRADVDSSTPGSLQHRLGTCRGSARRAARSPYQRNAPPGRVPGVSASRIPAANNRPTPESARPRLTEAMGSVRLSLLLSYPFLRWPGDGS